MPGSTPPLFPLSSPLYLHNRKHKTQNTKQRTWQRHVHTHVGAIAIPIPYYAPQQSPRTSIPQERTQSPPVGVSVAHSLSLARTPCLPNRASATETASPRFPTVLHGSPWTPCAAPPRTQKRPHPADARSGTNAAATWRRSERCVREYVVYSPWLLTAHACVVAVLHFSHHSRLFSLYT